MPLVPVPSPSMSSPSSTTTSAGPAATVMPGVPDTSTPASKATELIVIDLVMVTPPKPPGSSTLISPAGAVLEIAPAKVLHGAVRLHGLASSPTPETHVRVACAWASPGLNNATHASAAAARNADAFMLGSSNVQ